MKVKVINGNDMRLWRYSDKYNYDDLNLFITSTWNMVYGEYIIQYKDDENDLMTMSSSIDLKDALEFTQSQNQKSLKVYVKSIRLLQSSHCNQDTKESKYCSFGDMVLDFLNNKEIRKLLPELFGGLITKIISSNISDLEYKKYAKYIKLRKIKMPQQSIMNKMKFDGFSQNEINVFIENKFENKQETMKKYAKYIKLKKIKMPKQSIMNKMKFDGFSESEINSFFEKIQKTQCKILKVEEIINMIYRETQNCKFDTITQHPLYIKYGDVLIGFISQKIFYQQSLYKHFKFNTLKTIYLKQLIDILYKNISENEYKDFNSIKNNMDDLIKNMQFPLDTDYGEAIHFEIKCNECHCNPIIGQRYKCSICLNVNLCKKCERNHNERHPLILFKKSAKITSNVVVGDDNKDNTDNNIGCICGAKMESVIAKSAYNWTNIVFCDFCDKKYFNEMVYHCPNGRNIQHKQGYDLCVNCVSNKYEKQLKHLLV